MVRYYCSGFNSSNAFNYGLGEMFLRELKDTKSIVYIPGGINRVEKTRVKYIPQFTEHFKNIGIIFDEINLITPDLDKLKAQEMIKNASFIMLMGGDPFKQKEMCENLEIISLLREFDGVMLGYSAGAMLMSKYIIITPCSLEYPDFHIEEGLNFDEISIYPHNNTSLEEYPEVLVAGDEIYEKKDLIKVAKEYGEFYLLQDNLRENNIKDISVIKSNNGKIEFYKEQDGKIWIVNNEVKLYLTE